MKTVAQRSLERNPRIVLWFPPNLRTGDEKFLPQEVAQRLVRRIGADGLATRDEFLVCEDGLPASAKRQKLANCVLADVGLALAAIPFDVGVSEARVMVSVHYTKDEGGLGKYSWDLLLKRAGNRWVFERVLFVLT